MPVTSELLDAGPAREHLASPSPPAGPIPSPVPGPARTIDRLRVPPLTDRLTGWLVTGLITAIAFVIRLVDLGTPNKLVFDETYYAKDAYSLLRYGY